jgi:GR25 family glycosyltransferase involved in LPS biosynthesis/GT2 family glycosyltransferase
MNVAENLLRKLRCCEKYYAAVSLGKLFLNFNPKSNTLREEFALCYYFIKKYEEGLKILNDIEESRHGNKDLMDRTVFNKKFFLMNLEDKILESNSKLETIINIENCEKLSGLSLVTFSITTCRRLDLFIKTMNCFLSNCIDKHLISRWICVDDNSSEEDREIMRTKYPFFEFFFKNIDEKGHPESLQIITKHVNTPYLIHVEDDRALVDKRHYILDMIDILESDENIGQVCFNHNYMETVDSEIKGGFLQKTPNNVFYYEHEYCVTADEKQNFIDKYGHCSNCNYYPHFSLSPSMIKTKIFEKVQFQKERCFEFMFGLRYVECGYKTVFLPGYHIKHIGRLTSEINSIVKLNAYDLLETEQFQEKIKYKCFVINLDRRPDRYEKIKEQIQKKYLPADITKISACDGNKLVINPRLRSFCRNNNFYMRPGVIGCALSHLKLYQKLINDDVDGYVIFEDDVVSNDTFISRMKRAFTILENKTRPDIIFFLTTLKSYYECGILKKESREEIDKFSVGGTGCYYISKHGAQTVIDFIEKNTLDEAIDAILFKQSPFLNMYFVIPCIIENGPFHDTDIQNDFCIESHLYEKNLSNDDFSPHILYGHQNKLDLFDNLEFLE